MTTDSDRVSFWQHLGNSCAVDDRNVLHAASTPRPKAQRRRKTWDTACGKRARLLGFRVEGRPGTRMTAVWPPYASDAQEWGYERCTACMAAAPGKPVRPLFAKGVAS